MDAIKELLARLSTLTAEELTQLRSLVSDEFMRLDAEDATPEVVAAQNELADMAEQAGAEATNRAAAQQQAEADRETARQRIKALNGETDETEETPAEGEEGEETPVEGETAEPVAVTAAGRSGRVARMAAAQRKPQGSPEIGPQTPRTALVASAGMRGVDPGTEMDRDALAAAMTATLSRMPTPMGPKGAGGRGRDVLVASASWASQYPDERRLTGQFDHDQRLLNQVTSPQVLTASGGLCSPVNVDLTVGMMATADRPVRDALPTFDAPRGGLTYRPGPWTSARCRAPSASGR